jgi:regulator of PEP synthase PpsR (kinase-PPPase family)
MLDGKKPIVFTTLVNMEILQIIQEGCQGMLLDMFGTFVHPLEKELKHQVQPPRRSFQRCEQEQGVPGPYRGHQLLAGARRRAVQP